VYLVNTSGISECYEWEKQTGHECTNIDKLQKTQIMMVSVLYVASGSGLGQFQATWFFLDREYISAIPVNVSSPTTLFNTERWCSNTFISRCLPNTPCIGEAGVSRRELWKYEPPRCFSFHMDHWSKTKRLRTYDYIHSVRSFASRAYASTVVPCTSETPCIFLTYLPFVRLRCILEN